MEAAGIEPLAGSSGNTTIRGLGGAECGALGAPARVDVQIYHPPIDADLVAVIQAWPVLSEPVRAAILALARDLR